MSETINMSDSILYLGDTALDDAAAYLAGVMNHSGLQVDYVPSDQPASPDLFDEPRSLYVLSDYPAANLAGDLQRKLLTHVENGSGLLMCGGWESFHGVGGDWDGTAIGSVLPVQIAAQDDRVNCDHPVLLRRVEEHAILDDLPWATRPPVIGGFNRVQAKPEGRLLLEAVHFAARCEGADIVFDQTGSDPLLVVGTHGRGPAIHLLR